MKTFSQLRQQLRENESHGPTFDKDKGLGAVPDNSDIHYKGFVKHMSADHYLSLAAHHQLDHDTVEHIKKHLKSGKTLGNPYLNVQHNKDHNTFGVTGHDGRHRAMAIKHMYGGHTQIPVHIFPHNMRARHITDHMKNASFIPQDKYKSK